MRDPSWSDYNEGKKTATFQHWEVQESRISVSYKGIEDIEGSRMFL